MTDQVADPATARPGGTIDRAGPTPRAGQDRSNAVTIDRLRGWWRITEVRWYLAAVGLTMAAVTWMMRLWRADLGVPFYYSSDVLGSAAHFETIRETGWYEYQPRLGAPYGQHYHDYPFSDDLHMFMAKFVTWFTPNWMVAFNTYYLLTFVLAAAAAVWFFRVCGLRPAMAIVLAVLFAVAPYHFLRNEMHLFLAGYYVLPLAMVVVLRVARGETVWGRRPVRNPLLAALGGRGAATVLIMCLVVYDGIYYALFTGILLIAAGLLAYARTRDGLRVGGAFGAAGVLAGWYLIAFLPDLVYGLINGSNGDAFVRYANDAQFYALRFAHLVLPAPGHPLPMFAELRDWYQTTYPPDAEKPALGLVATIGFVVLLVLGVAGMARARRRHRSRAALTVDQLSALTWVAFLTATTGGLGMFISMVVVAIRGWNRMSIVIALLALAGFGLVVQGLQARAIRRWRYRPAARRLVRSWVVAAVVLVVGVADQSIDIAVPDYDGVGETFAVRRRLLRRAAGRTTERCHGLPAALPGVSGGADHQRHHRERPAAGVPEQHDACAGPAAASRAARRPTGPPTSSTSRPTRHGPRPGRHRLRRHRDRPVGELGVGGAQAGRRDRAGAAGQRGPTVVLPVAGRGSVPRWS